ncbi:unnamed protein product [Echinostoma caproni]|uniref:Ubiquitin-like-conjugating enzyme ATG10 n=1 Tax=Echinostoma caproni TaxID=27848 RepID=A0A183B1N2_9TREM|nr:unnamed protein product [Echinostoma caproni]
MIQERDGRISLSVFQVALRNLYDLLVRFSESTIQWQMEDYPNYEYSELVGCRYESNRCTSALASTECESPVNYKIEYRVSYSVAYEVPILMVRVQTFSGCILSIDGLWDQLVQSNFGSVADDGTVLQAGFSQIEHPYLGIPYYQFHPCRTAALMQQAFSMAYCSSEISGVKYLTLWLSLIATPLGLVLPKELALNELERNSGSLTSVHGDHVRYPSELTFLWRYNDMNTVISLLLFICFLILSRNKFGFLMLNTVTWKEGYVL